MEKLNTANHTQGLWISISIQISNMHWTCKHTFSGSDSKIATLLNDHRLNILQVIQPPRKGYNFTTLPTSVLVSRWTSQWLWTCRIFLKSEWWDSFEDIWKIWTDWFVKWGPTLFKKWRMLFDDFEKSAICYLSYALKPRSVLRWTSF